jgi:hypothetical protein
MTNFLEISVISVKGSLVNTCPAGQKTPSYNTARDNKHYNAEQLHLKTLKGIWCSDKYQIIIFW